MSARFAGSGQGENIDAFRSRLQIWKTGALRRSRQLYYKYKNLQVSSFQPVSPDQKRSPVAHLGLEGSLRYKLTDAFNVNTGAAYTHARYESFKNAPYYTIAIPLSLLDGQLVASAIGTGFRRSEYGIPPVDSSTVGGRFSFARDLR